MELFAARICLSVHILFSRRRWRGGFHFTICSLVNEKRDPFHPPLCPIFVPPLIITSTRTERYERQKDRLPKNNMPFVTYSVGKRCIQQHEVALRDMASELYKLTNGWTLCFAWTFPNKLVL